MESAETFGSTSRKQLIQVCIKITAQVVQTAAIGGRCYRCPNKTAFRVKVLVPFPTQNIQSIAKALHAAAVQVLALYRWLEA
jgi:hypothetical protein